jgi:hypothetical protein
VDGDIGCRVGAVGRGRRERAGGPGQEGRLHELPRRLGEKGRPAFKEVAAKYKGKADAEATLFTKIKDGKGHPGTKASDNDLKGILKWVLAQ